MKKLILIAFTVLLTSCATEVKEENQSLVDSTQCCVDSVAVDSVCVDSVAVDTIK